MAFVDGDTHTISRAGQASVPFLKDNSATIYVIATPEP